jgi:predicted PurR-regulated permease PerM
LRLWLTAQLIAMIIVGVLTAAGLWLIGLPSALALGLISGLAEFVPVVGPVASVIPGLLIASSFGLETMLWTLAVYIIVQQVESNLVMPLLIGQAVNIPPALALFAVVGLSVLLGPLGLLFAFPLTVVADVAVRRLYVRDTLGEEVEITAEKS